MAARSGPDWPRVGADGRSPVHFPCPSLYNLVALTLMRRTHLLVLAVLVAAFVTLYPSLGVADHSCDAGECPQVAHVGTMASACLAAVCAAAVLSVPYAASVLGVFSKRRILPEPRPSEAYLPPDTRPPRLSLSR
jgi:hypothetical protein